MKDADDSKEREHVSAPIPTPVRALVSSEARDGCGEGTMSGEGGVDTSDSQDPGLTQDNMDSQDLLADPYMVPCLLCL